jgi:hypothetical protein
MDEVDEKELRNAMRGDRDKPDMELLVPILDALRGMQEGEQSEA